MVNMSVPFKYFILVSEVGFDLEGQRSYFEKGPWLRRSKVIKRMGLYKVRGYAPKNLLYHYYQ